MLAVLALAFQAATAPAPPDKCTAYADQVVGGLAGDRAAALGAARRMRRECRNDFEALFRAGRALSRASGFEKGEHRDLRQHARPLLDRAAQLRSSNAGAWLEYGLLLRKQGGIQVDAQRAIRRALQLADEQPDSTPPTVLAEINFQRGRYYQDELDRMRWLKQVSALGVTSPSCVGMGAFCENYTRPADFNRRLDETPAAVTDFAERRERVLRYLESAARLDPANLEAFERNGRELALGEEWERLEAAARQAEAAGRFGGLATAVRGLAAARQGRLRAADSLYRVALTRLPDSLRRWYERPPAGLDAVPDFWSRARPLWVTGFNELQVEYWTRMTYALLVLRDREADVEGPETPIGDALIRYGWPRRITQVTRNAGQILSSAGYEAAQGYLDCAASTDPAACVPAPGGDVRDESGGRWLFWTYAPDRPSLMFELRTGARVPQYLFDASAAEYAERLRAASPFTFRSQLAPKVYRLPVQVARFKGVRPGETTVGVHSLVAARQMELPPQDSVEVGLFLFADTAGFPLVARRTATYQVADGVALSYAVNLEPGRYAYSLEAFVPAFGGAATVRDSLVVPAWPPDSLLVSDLLVAHGVTPRVEGDPLTWRDLGVEPSRTLEVTPGSSLWVVWEVYGARPDERGNGRYEVALSLQDAAARSLPLRLLERMGVRRAGAQGVRLEWTAERRLAADGRALEFVQLELPPEAEGEYRLDVTVREGGRVATMARRLAVVPLPVRPPAER
jgi:tetratricopeptide (TPR) repeat protein